MSNLFPYFPMFLDLVGRSAVLLGGDQNIAALARQCLDAGASVSVFDSAPCDALRAIAPPVRLTLRRWRAPDLKGATLVATAEANAMRARTAAHAAGAVFHAFGAPELSDVAFGAMAARGAWSVGIGAPRAPGAFSDAVRRRLEETLPAGLGDCLAAGERIREEVEKRVASSEGRARFWAALADCAFDREPADAAEWDQRAALLLEAAEKAETRGA